jgi:hypothetical protein
LSERCLRPFSAFVTWSRNVHLHEESESESDWTLFFNLRAGDKLFKWSWVIQDIMW